MKREEEKRNICLRNNSSEIVLISSRTRVTDGHGAAICFLLLLSTILQI